MFLKLNKKRNLTPVDNEQQKRIHSDFVCLSIVFVESVVTGFDSCFSLDLLIVDELKSDGILKIEKSSRHWSLEEHTNSKELQSKRSEAK